MKQIHYSVIGEALWARDHNVTSKHPQERMRELGFNLLVCVPETIADCWNCLVEDFNFELPDYILSSDEINWSYFYGHRPEATITAMVKCGVDYKPIEEELVKEREKANAQIENNHKLFNGFAIKSVANIKAFNLDKDVVWQMTMEE